MQVPREGLEQKLQKLSSSQASIESVSAFCIFYHKDARGVVQIWDQEFYKAPPERKLSLLYLANHVLQEGRRKGTGFVDEFYKVLPKALSHLLKHGDEKSKKAVTRLVAVWEERRVFGSKHIKSFREVLPGSGQAKAGGSSSSSSSSLKQLGPAGAALAATQQAAATVTEKQQEFNKSMIPVSKAHSSFWSQENTTCMANHRVHTWLAFCNTLVLVKIAARVSHTCVLDATDFCSNLQDTNCHVQLRGIPKQRCRQHSS
jgi:hypothetical protein